MRSDVEESMKSGIVTVVGRPNVGKSTLVNAMVGEKILIVTDKPQTTRQRVRAVMNEPRGQIVLVDTPGLHRPMHLLGSYLEKEVLESLAGVDVVCYVAESSDRRVGRADRLILEHVGESDRPVVLVLNKIDRLSGPDDFWPAVEAYSPFFTPRTVVPVSAISGVNIDVLKEKLFDLLPEGPPIYEDDRLADCTERFLAAEVIREQVLLATEQEVPHSVAVIVDEFLSPDEYPEGRHLSVRATIIVERTGQKGIIIGNRGSRLKSIGEQARKVLEDMFGFPMYLDLWVKVRPGWRNSRESLRRLGYQ